MFVHCIRHAAPTRRGAVVALATSAVLGTALLAPVYASDALNENRKIVKNGDYSVEVIVNGDSGPLVVLLPSWGRDSEEFGPLADHMAKAGFKVLRPVPRGAGKTDGPYQNISMFDWAKDVIAVIENEKAGPAVVAGHAFGAYLARATATARPDLVSGVALLSAGQRAPIAEDLRQAILKAGRTSLSEEERLGYLRLVFFAPGNDPKIWLTGWHPNTGKACASAFKTPKEEYWQAGGKPVLDVIPGKDPLRPESTYNENREDLGEARVTVAVIPDASHALIPEQPAAVADALLKFAKQVQM